MKIFRLVAGIALLSLVIPSMVILAQEEKVDGVQAAEAKQDEDGKQEFELPKANEDGWIPLFNGVDLTGWTPKIRGYDLGENFANTFRVEDGVLKVSYDGYDRFDDKYGHLFYQQKFSHFALRVEYRFVGEQVAGGPGWAWRNSGAMLHGQAPESMGRDQNFPVSIEAQFLGGNGKDERPTLNLCTPGTHVVMDGKLHTPHCKNSASPTIHGDEWVVAVMEVHGNDVIRHFVNDNLVMEYQNPQLDPKDTDAKPLIINGQLQLDSGWISLQSESHPIEFRKVEIRLLDRDSANSKKVGEKPAPQKFDNF